AKIENGGRAVTRDNEGNLKEFIIGEIEDSDETGTYKRVFAEGGEYELNDEFLPSYIQSSVTLRQSMTAVLQGTRWQLGETDINHSRSIDLKNMSVKEAVVELVNQYGGEVNYRVET